MTADLLAWLTDAMDAAQRLADRANGNEWMADASEPGTTWVLNEHMHLMETDAETAAHVVAHDPAAVLRRIAADRKLIAECEKVLAVEDWEYDDAPTLAAATIRIIAEGYGRTGAA